MTNLSGKVWIVLCVLAVAAIVAVVTIKHYVLKHFALSPENTSIHDVASRIENESYLVANCEMLAKLTNRYFSANPTLHEAPLFDFVGPGKYIEVIVPVAGETYPSVVSRDGVITVVLRDGASFVYDPNTGEKTYLPAAAVPVAQ